MPKYTGKVLIVNDKRYGVADRVSAGVLIFSQVTGRFSQVGPPMAQLPMKMRKLVGVDPCFPQLGYDYEGIEGRILATVTGDEILLGAFEQGWDLHTINACDLFGLEYPSDRTKKCHTNCAEWAKEYNWSGEEDPRRKFAKIFFYRVIYRGDPKSCHKIPGANKLGMSKAELEKAAYRWLAAHGKLQQFWQTCDEDAIERFVSRTLAGRKRILTSLDEGARSREGTNYRMQALVTTVVNETIIQTKALSAQDIFLCGQMHDSLLWAIREERYEDLKPKALAVAQSERNYSGVKFVFPVSHYEKPC